MKSKQLEAGSAYAKYDTDGDGVVSDAELATTQQLQELELLHEKADSQKNMAWVALVSMCLFALLPILPFVPESRLETLSQAGIVGLYFGATAFMSKHGKQ